VPLAKRADVIDQVLEMALHPGYGCMIPLMSASIMIGLTQSPEAHAFITWKDVAEKMIEICKLRYRMVSDERQSSESQQGKEDPMVVNDLK
jgi:NifU-like protein involved in Fe-S cluster formation